MDTGTRRRAVWMSVVICILSRITSVHLQIYCREYVVAVGQEVTLTCDITNPAWIQHDNSKIRSVTWRRGEGSGATEIDLTNSREARITATEDDNQHMASIRIKNVQRSDAGVYSCMVKREFVTESWMEIITMEVSAKPSRSVTEGETVTLTCDISNSGDGTGLVWYHGVTYIDKGNRLTLNKVKRSQQGEWKCFLHDQHNSPFASYKLNFTSTGSDDDDGQALAVKKYFIHEGGEVSLSCNESDPGFKWKDHSLWARAVTWKWRSHDGTTQGSDQNLQDPPQSSHYRDQFPLKLSKVTFSHGGFYTCEFTGYYRTGNLTMELVTMKVSANPSRSVKEGENVTLTYDISNSAYGTGLVWYHGGTYIDQGNRLTLNKVKRSQQGEWKCVLYDQHNRPFASYKLEFTSTGSDVGQAPAVKKYFIHEGGKVSLSCDESDPGFQWKDHSQLAPAVTWKSHDGTIKRYDQNIQNPPQSSDYKDQFPLKLSQVTLSHGGVYTCEFTGYYRTGTLIMELVTMKVSANPSRSVTDGATVTLKCDISNSTYVQSIVWTHGGIEMNKGNSVLTLHKVKRCQEGAWTCGVKTQTDQASASHDLKVSSQNFCEVKGPAPRKHFASVGQTVILPCVESDLEFKWEDHPSSDLDLTWRWERQGSGSATIVQYQKQTGQWKGDISINPARITALKSAFDQDNFSIEISNVQHSDAGLYICHFAGYFRTSSLTRELITMQVSANPSSIVSEGGTVILACLISNRTYVKSIVWTHGGIEMNPGNSVLTLNKVKRSQQGQWECVLHDQHNSPFASYTLEFTSTGSDDGQAPAVKTYFIHEGAEVSLSCDESDPGFKWKDHSQRTRTATWKSHNGTIRGYYQNLQNPSRLYHYKDQFPLTLPKVTFSHGGVYTCEFTGYYRTGNLTMELITIKVLSNTSDTVAEGESISLTCQLSNDSYAHMVRWIHNGIEISHKSSLVLVKVKAAQSGLWKCSLERESGEISEVAYNLDVRKIGAEKNATRNYAAQIGQGATLPCNESDPGFEWRSSSTESRSVTWYWRPRDNSTIRTILAAHPAGPHAAFSSHLNSHVNISSSAFDDDDFSLTISVVKESSAGVYTCQLTGYYRSGSLMSELFTTQVPKPSSYVSIAVGVVLAVLLFVGAAVVAVLCYRRRKLNAGPQHGHRNSVNLQEMTAGDRTTDENRQAIEEEALVYSQIEVSPASSGSRPQHNQNVGVIYASVNAEQEFPSVWSETSDIMPYNTVAQHKNASESHEAQLQRAYTDQHNNEVVYSAVQAPAADNMKPKVKLKGHGGDPNAVVNRPEHDNSEVVYSMVQVPAAGNMKPKPKPKPKRDGGDPNAVVNRSEHDNNEVVYSVVQAPAAGNIKPKLKPKPKRDGGDPNAVVNRPELDKNEAVYSMVQAPVAGNMNPNAVVNRPKPEENQVVYSLLSTPNTSKPALKPKPNKEVEALYNVVAKKK